MNAMLFTFIKNKLNKFKMIEKQILYKFNVAGKLYTCTIWAVSVI